jgi:ribonuclease HII
MSKILNNENLNNDNYTIHKLEKSFLNNSDICEIGVDEAGRGPMFGRVYTAAVVLPYYENSNFDFNLMKDSKKFHSEKKLEKVAKYIMENAISYDVQYAEADDIDNSNILKVTIQTMTKTILNVVEKLENTSNIHLLIDGNYFKPIMRINNEGLSEIISYNCIEGGDNKYCCIAAASILAKYFRDKYILDLCEKEPELDEKYGLKKNKGYGTMKHMEGIKTHGITKYHRKSFGICKTFNL